MNPKLVFVIRVVLAAVWLYNGLWLKVLSVDAHHLQIVTSVVHGTAFDAGTVLRSIGLCETLLGLGILSGLYSRFVSYFQICIILLMNLLGIVFGGGAIEHPIGLVISNLPTIACATVVLLYGPGAYSLRLPQNARQPE